MVRLLLTSIGVLGLVMFAGGQADAQNTDFSGTWTLDRDASEVQQAPGGGGAGGRRGGGGPGFGGTGPVTVTMPRGVSEISRKISPIPRSSMVRTLDGMVLKTPPAPRFWLNAFTLNLATPGTSKEKSHSKNSS